MFDKINAYTLMLAAEFSQAVYGGAYLPQLLSTGWSLFDSNQRGVRFLIKDRNLFGASIAALAATSEALLAPSGGSGAPRSKPASALDFSGNRHYQELFK